VTTQPLRQWACFPRDAINVNSAAPQTFRLLIESSGGRMAIATLVMRTSPDVSIAEALAHLIDEPHFADVTLLQLEGEFECRHGHRLELLNIDLDHDDPLTLTEVIPRTLIALAQQPEPTQALLSLTLRRADVLQRCETEWQSARDSFIENLDPAAVGEVRASGTFTPQAYNYVSTVSATLRRNRAQALTLFPLLRGRLMDRDHEPVRVAIDAGHSLIAALAAQWQAPKALVKCLCGITASDLGTLAGNLPLVLRLMRDIPPDWWPRTPERWRQFAKAADTVSEISRCPIGMPANQLWLRQSARNGFDVGDSAPEELVRMGEEISDFMDMLRRALAWHFAEATKVRSGGQMPRVTEITVAVRSGIPIVTLARIARRFGDTYRRANERFASEAELWRGVRWPTLIEQPYSYNNLHIHALANPAALCHEGVRMRNCVASYVAECLRGKSQIWSVREWDGTPVATLETKLRVANSGRRDLQVVQLKGFANQACPQAAREAVNAMLRDVTSEPHLMDSYLDWRQKVHHRTLAQRQHYALMQPIVEALQGCLPGRFAWERLVGVDTQDA
jgi:hypothetical protein